MTRDNTTPSANTPAPWTLLNIEEDGVMYRLQGNDDLPDIAEIFIRNSDEEMDANARLISSAPELLECLKTVITHIEHSPHRPCVGLTKARSLVKRIEQKD